MSKLVPYRICPGLASFPKIHTPRSKVALVYLRFYITFCTALVFDYFMPRIDRSVKTVPRLNLFSEYNLDLSYFAPPRSSLFFGWLFGIWFRINFGLLSPKSCPFPIYSENLILPRSWIADLC